MVKKSYKVGSNQMVRRWISKTLDRKIKAKERDLKSKVKNPKNISYLYASKMLEVKK